MGSSSRIFIGLLLNFWLSTLTVSTSETSELMEKSSIYCHKNGVYDESTKKCICIKGFTGDQCSSCDTDFVDYPECISCHEYCLEKQKQPDVENQKKCMCSNVPESSKIFPSDHSRIITLERFHPLIETVKQTIMDYIRTHIKPPIVLAGVDLNLSQQNVICRLRFHSNLTSLTEPIQIRDEYCRIILNPTNLSWNASVGFAVSLDNGFNWMAWIITCHTTCAMSSYSYKLGDNSTAVITNNTTTFAANTTSMNNVSTSVSPTSTQTMTVTSATLTTTRAPITTVTTATTTTMLTINRNHSIQFSLVLPLLSNETTPALAASNLGTALSQALDINPQQFNVSVSFPSARAIMNATARVLLYGTAKKNATMILEDLKAQLNDSNSKLRQNRFTSSLTINSLQSIMQQFTCGDIIKDVSCSTSTSFVSLNLFMMNFLLALFFTKST